MTHPEDLALVRDALARIPAAVAALGERMQCVGPIVRARQRKLAPWLPEQALKDLEQDVAIKVLERLPMYRGLAALESWIFAFCEGVVRNAGRRHRRTEERQHPLEAATDAATQPQEVECYDDLYGCIENLGTAERELVRAKHWEGLLLEQLAARVRAGLNTVKSRYYRALKLLRQCLERAGKEAR